MILASASPLNITLALGAAAAYTVSAVGAERLGAPVARAAVRLGWLLHGAVLAWSMFGEAPRFGFAPALSVTAWLVAAVYAIESHVYPLLQTRWALSTLGAIVVLLAALFPGNLLHATASPWLPVH